METKMALDVSNEALSLYNDTVAAGDDDRLAITLAINGYFLTPILVSVNQIKNTPSRRKIVELVNFMAPNSSTTTCAIPVRRAKAMATKKKPNIIPVASFTLITF
jgi:hypothetical protein